MHRLIQRASILPKLSTLLLVAYILLTLYALSSIFIGAGYDPILTPLGSVLAFSFAIAHGSQRLGWKNTLLLLGITFAVSLAFESVGVATGIVYGKYHYTEMLGAKFLGLVPWIIPVAWFMMTYPSFIIASRIGMRRILSRRILPPIKNLWGWRLSLAALGAVIMTSWDLAMDPYMVRSGHWVWDQPGAYFGIPLQNFWGWWLTIFVAFLLFLVVSRLTPTNLETAGNEFEQLAVLSYIFTGVSAVLVDFRIGLVGPGLVGLFAMAPWAILGWWKLRQI